MGDPRSKGKGSRKSPQMAPPPPPVTQLSANSGVCGEGSVRPQMGGEAPQEASGQASGALGSGANTPRADWQVASGTVSGTSVLTSVPGEEGVADPRSAPATDPESW